MEKEKLTNSIVKAIAYTENGGKPDLSNLKQGKSGEMKSIFQYTPETWKKNSEEVFKKSDTPLTPDNETYVTQQVVKKWIDKGYNANQIASMWNAGEGEPDAYSGKFSDGSSSRGVNKKGVNFDVPSYSKKVVNYARGFYGQSTNPSSVSDNSGANLTTPPISQTQYYE